MRLLVTRPSRDSAAMAEKLSGSRVTCLLEPMLEIVYPPMDAPDLTGIQGILVTSANGIRAFAKLSDRRDIVVWAVGPASAQEARELEFSHVHHGSGDVAGLAELVREHREPGKGPLLHVAGTRLAGDLAGMLEKSGYEYRRAILYEAKTTSELSAAAQLELRDGMVSGVAFFSPRTAETFVRVVTSAGLSHVCAQLTAFCLSKAVADKASALDWFAVVIAEHPNEDSLVTTVLQVAENV